MERTLAEIVLEETLRVLPEQRSDGSFPPGHNGPYDDPETPTRNTSHWLVTLSRLSDGEFSEGVSGEQEERIQSAAVNAIEYLESDDCRPHDATFLHRTQEGKDRCNGLIGQAWTIEALVATARAFDREDLAELAADVFLLHPFDESVGLWQRVDTDGSVLGFDRTFNHQLWFAAAGGELAAVKGGRVDDQVRRFLDYLPVLMDVDDDGMIRHLLRPGFGPSRYFGMLFDGDRRELCRNALLHPVRPPSNKRTLRRKAVGYHSFNLYALAMLYERYPEHPVWESDPMSAALEYATSDVFRERLDGNPYGYPYNCSGIELAYSLSAFDEIDEEGQRDWLHRQFDRTFDPDAGAAVRNTPDPVTLTARLYEATRIPNPEITLDLEEP